MGALTQNLSEKDIKFLKALKSQGVDAQTALSRLQKVKSQAQGGITAKPQPQVMPAKDVKSMLNSGYMPKSTSGLGDYLTATHKKKEIPTIDSIGESISKIPEAIYGSTVKLAGDSYNTMAGTTLASGQGILGGLSALNPLDFKPQEFEKRFKKGLTSPTIIGTNPYKADSSGNVDATQSVKNIAGAGLKGAAGTWNALTLGRAGGLLNKFLPNAAAGAALSVGEDLQNNNDLTSTGINALLSGGLQGAFASAPNLVKGARKTVGKLSGLSDSTIELLQNPELGKNALKELSGAKVALRDETLNNPLQKAGQEVFKPAVNKLYNQNKELGKELGNVIKGSSITATLKDPYTVFSKKLKDLGAIITNKGIKFDEFSPIDSPSDLKQIGSVFSTLKKYSQKEIPIPKIHDLTRKIDNILDYSSKTANPVSTPAEAALKEARKALSNLVKNKVPESKGLFDQISHNHQILDFFNPKLGENASSAGILKGIFSPQRKDALLPMIQNLEQKTGKQIINPTKVAKAAMEIAGDPRGDMLLEAAKNPNVKGLFKTFGKILAAPTRAAKGLVREGKNVGFTGVLPKGLTSKGAIVPTAISDALLNLLGTRSKK